MCWWQTWTSCIFPIRSAASHRQLPVTTMLSTAQIKKFILLFVITTTRLPMAESFQTRPSSPIMNTQTSSSNASSKRPNNSMNGSHFASRPNEKTPLMLEVPSGGSESTETSLDTVPDETSASIAKGRAILCLVAFLYGTLNVSLRLIYQLDSPPTAAALSTSRGWLASACFLPLLLLKPKTPATTNAIADEEAGSASDQTNPIKPQSTSSLWMAGIELGLWNFLAQGLINVGLLTVGSARASFLTQTSVIMTPLLSIVAGQSVSKSVWVGCALALGGLTLLSGGGGDDASAMALAFSAGDLLILTGAFSWSLYLFRLSKVAPKFDEINLQAIKTTMLAVFYTTWLGFSLYQNPAGISWGWVANGVAWVALIYSAAAPGTIADILQQQGQKEVSASEGMFGIENLSIACLRSNHLHSFSTPIVSDSSEWH